MYFRCFLRMGEPVWVTLLIFSATIDYFHGRICERYAGRWQAKAALVSSLVVNLGLLGVFKYSGMLVESVNSLTGLSLPVPAFSLPIGISFYTFQTISYVIDVYRGQAKGTAIPTGAFYVCFHVSAAGGRAIVRYTEVAYQIQERQTSRADFIGGISVFAPVWARKCSLQTWQGTLPLSIWMETWRR